MSFTTAPLAAAFEWPFSTEEFQKKLSSRDLAPATRYFARGPHFLVGQKWDETRFISQLQAQNYRMRDSGQLLLPGDAQKLTLSECRTLTNSPDLSEGHTCWMWQTHQNELYLVGVSPENMIEATRMGGRPYWKASLDPVLVAQYRGQQPIMQNELRIADFPVNCMNATMAIEDSDFLEHSGLSYMGLTRSLFKNIVQRKYAQGGSTITQQLVKNYFLSPEKTIKRKLKELYLAVKLESEWTKDQILETYLNIIYMGQSGAFQVLGFGAASQYYFGKPVQKLNLPECALMAAIVNHPGGYNPWKNPERARNRRQLVLTKMKEHNLITEKEFSEASTHPLPQKTVMKAAETAPYFFEAVRKQLTELNIQNEARTIYTSLDLDSQQIAQNVLQKNIADLEKNKKNLIKNKESGLRLEGILISTENRTGLITAFVGGQSYRQTQFNRALNSRRQIGSLIKPVVYLAALQNGRNPQSIVQDTPFTWSYEKKTWSPVNYDKKFRGEVPLYYALKESLNAPTARIAQEVGLAKIIQLAHDIGFSSKIDPIPAASLGASTHTAVEVADAFRTYANFGQFTKSGFIEKVTDSTEKTIFEHNPLFEQKIEPENAAVLVGMMKETLRSGTAKMAASSGWNAPTAGKTGTTSDNKDAWFTGFTPFQTTVVWLGYDQSLSSQLTGASGAVPIWIDYMKQTGANWSVQDFKWPENVHESEVPLYGTDKTTKLILKN